MMYLTKITKVVLVLLILGILSVSLIVLKFQIEENKKLKKLEEIEISSGESIKELNKVIESLNGVLLNQELTDEQKLSEIKNIKIEKRQYIESSHKLEQVLLQSLESSIIEFNNEFETMQNSDSYTQGLEILKAKLKIIKVNKINLEIAVNKI